MSEETRLKQSIAKKDYIKRNPEKALRDASERGKKGGAKTVKLMAENSPCSYDGLKFLSKSEIKCYRYLKELNVPFIYDFRIGSKQIDFFIGDFILKRGFFWEHHPLKIRYERTEDYGQYYTQRRRALDEAGFQDYKLVVTTNLKELNIIKEEIIKLNLYRKI